jgi:hypothetical protein
MTWQGGDDVARRERGRRRRITSEHAQSLGAQQHVGERLCASEGDAAILTRITRLKGIGTEVRSTCGGKEREERDLKSRQIR